MNSKLQPSLLSMALLACLGTLLSRIQADFLWSVHDPQRPQPPVVRAGQDGSPPSDARVLIGPDADACSQLWQSAGKPLAWAMQAGELTVKPGSGDINTVPEFGDCQLHLEWRIPAEREVHGQSGGNSGLFFMQRYELQILQSNQNETYADGMAASLYGQYPPLVNACLPAGEWNTYDVTFRAPVFDDTGALQEPAFMSVHFNGVLVQDNVRLLGPTKHKQRTSYTAHGARGPLSLQDHGDPISFRNMWIRELEPRRGPQ